MNAARTIIECLRSRAATATGGMHVYLNEDSELDKQAAAHLERLVALVEGVHDRDRHWTVALTVAATGTTAEARTARVVEVF